MSSSSEKETSSGSTSHSLIDQLKDNDQDAWQRMFAIYEPLIRFWCHRAGLKQQHIDDIVQDVLQTVSKGIEKFSHDRPGGTFRGWLRTITHSRVIDWRRRNKNKLTAIGGSTAQQYFSEYTFDEQPSEYIDVESREAEAEEIQQMYLRALKIVRSNFREKTWRAFCEVVIESKSPNEVAATLGISPSTVRVAKSRVLNRLRMELGENPEQGQ